VDLGGSWWILAWVLVDLDVGLGVDLGESWSGSWWILTILE
jgi:hypothetical protein